MYSLKEEISQDINLIYSKIHFLEIYIEKLEKKVSILEKEHSHVIQYLYCQIEEEVKNGK